MIEKYCGCLLENLSTMRKERECPKEAMEAVATLIFAAARFSDLPELAELRLVFNERYETQINTCLNPEFVEKMQKKTFHKEKKLQLMQDISQEYSVSWNVKAFEDQILKSCQPEQSKKLLPAKDKAFSEILHEGTSYKEQLDASTKYEPHGSSVQRHQVRSEDQSDIHLNLKSDNIYSTDAIGTIKKQRSVNQRRELTRQNRFHHDSEDLQERELQNDPRKDSLMKITGASIASIVPNTARASEDLIVASGHVHPRLPDYDNLAARIATLSSSSA
ncbi:hypothetical protein AXF42_Ash019853 [Apostasia shenzhenica]|uniref:IST1-like protein n=1 Tax=Apostasia shenzhenica TaxID=1088818 RepID=A0A2H9ZX52_9ASPA|nr:hypothetical protein AXF42_Ash019853 [Apostasia shenzhenica]